MELTDAQLQTLRHMLGIDRPDIGMPVPCRNYAAVNPGDAEYLALEQAGAVERYSMQGSYWWYRTSDAGQAAALASHRDIRLPKAKRLYLRYLDVADVHPDLTFKEFLTSRNYAESRLAA